MIFFRIILFLLCTSSLYSQVIFRIDEFSVAEKDLSMLGATKILNAELQLNSLQSNISGAAWYKARKINVDQGFQTEFTYRVSGDVPGGNGFSFVIQNEKPDFLTSDNNYPGYSGLHRSVIIEFDTHHDSDDESNNHVSLVHYQPEKTSYYPEATVHAIPEIKDGKEHVCRIEYGDGELKVYLDAYIFPILTAKMDIRSHLEDTSAWLGFVSTTGSGFSSHNIISWNLSQDLQKPEDIQEERITVADVHTIELEDRLITLRLWDHNKVDGDVISLKLDDRWILTEHTLTEEKYILPIRLTGFQNRLTVYSNDEGEVSPNTVSIEIDDSVHIRKIVLESDEDNSQAIILRPKPQ